MRVKVGAVFVATHTVEPSADTAIPNGSPLTGIGDPIAEYVRASITTTRRLTESPTHTRDPSGENASGSGDEPAAIVLV